MHCSQAWDGIEPTFLTGELWMAQKWNDSINTRVPVVPLVFLYEDIRFWSHDRRILDLVNKQLRSRKLRGRRGRQYPHMKPGNSACNNFRDTPSYVGEDPPTLMTRCFQLSITNPEIEILAFSIRNETAPIAMISRLIAPRARERICIRERRKKRVEILTWGFFRGRKEDSAQIVCGN